MTIISLSLAIILGNLPLLRLPTLPTQAQLTTITIVGLLSLLWARGYWRIIGWTLLSFCWAVTTARQPLELLNQLTARPVDLLVEISALDTHRQRVRLKLLQKDQQRLTPQLQAWSYGLPMAQFCLGQRWQMRLILRPVHGFLNQGGFDTQRNAFAKQELLQAKVVRKQAIDTDCALTDRLLAVHQQRIAKLPQRGVLEALAFGDRQHLAMDVNKLFRETGIAHLMAISGMHIGMIYGIGWSAIRLLQLLFPWRWITPLVPELLGVAMAAGYCWLSGAQPSALRALLALSLWFMTRRSGINFSSGQILLLCAAMLLLFDPLIGLSDSFWLSVLAVSSILICNHWLPLPKFFRHRRRWALARLLHLQLGLLLIMAPIQIALFHGISLTALQSNLLAIPWVTLTIMPLIACALLIPFPSGSQLAWHSADTLLEALIWLLKQQPQGWWWGNHSLCWAALLWGGVLMLRSGGWRGYPGYCLGYLVIIYSLMRAPNPEKWRIDMLDVGHGLAVVISQGDEALIYDTGNRWRNGDAGSSIIAPWLRYQGLTPILAMISHRHLDHFGGFNSLRQAWPQLGVRSAFEIAGRQPCRRGLTWRWQQLTLQILWPLTDQTPGGNNDSCTLRISDGRYSLLLTGDLERAGEQQLVQREQQALASTFLQVPHHGSRTSSTALLLRKVNGQVALASTARYNPWRFPSLEVVKRYQQAGYRWYDTAVAGQLSIRVFDNSYQILQMREQISPRWYHQWFGKKPELR